MTIDLTTLDAHEQPSDELRRLWKAYSRTEHAEFISHPDIDELDVKNSTGKFQVAGSIPSAQLQKSYTLLTGGAWNEKAEDAPIYFHPLLPGLLIVPSLVPPALQKTLLTKMIHRDLANPTHQTNLHLHYELPYLDAQSPCTQEVDHTKSAQLPSHDQPCTQGVDQTRSFFAYSRDSPARFTPKDPTVHKPLSIRQVLERRLSWVTLGGQYDWTNREYPKQLPPDFPHDIGGFLQTLFPDTIAQAAIVNFYSPGDTMMMHRDVSEETDKGLVSLSLGCDALFMIAPNEYEKTAQEIKDQGEDREGKKGAEKPYLLLRLRSGDAIYMSEESRYAWHGVPKVLRGTCPEFLQDWPAEGEQFGEWKGWMKNKRINLNVRQMRD
ncbi:hypothetical protein F5Y18DRAFT_277793 [Xylariaceae sp. FL1019]|nr:hypothetical protein F5Y18DRAFT_277793 [Xylariaceae sp. FL1019]